MAPAEHFAIDPNRAPAAIWLCQPRLEHTSLARALETLVMIGWAAPGQWNSGCRSPVYSLHGNPSLRHSSRESDDVHPEKLTMIKDRISEPGGLISDIVGHLLHMGIWVLALGIAEGTDNAFGPFGWLGYLGIIFASAIIILFGGVLSFRTSINGCFEELDRILTTPRTFQAGYEWLNQRLESWRESLVWRCLGYCLICAFAVATATIQWESLATILPENRFLSVLYMIVVFHAIFITSIVAASYVVGRLAGTIRQGGGNPGQG